MAAKTFLLLNSLASGSTYGSLQDGGSVSTATTATGWTVGTTVATAYANQVYASKVAAVTFGATQQPAAAPANAGECWRSPGVYTGIFEAGTWTIKISVISVTAAASGAGKLRFRIWKSANADGSVGVELTTSTMSTGQWSNLTTSTAQNLSSTQSIIATTFTAEYLFIEIASEIDTASGSTTADVLIRVDSTNSVITTPSFDQRSSGDYIAGTTDTFYDSLIASATGAQIKINGDAALNNIVIYKNIGWYITGSVWESWTTIGQPSTTATNPSTGHSLTFLSNEPLL